MESGAQGQRFSVDIAGLLEALTEQFPEPLLCVRELVQNAADASANRIEVDVSYDAARGTFRLAVCDDGRGMNEAEVEGYLTIGFSEKSPESHRGRFGVGKLSPYALGITHMDVETSDGHVAHHLSFNGDGSGTIEKVAVRSRGTLVRVYKTCTRAEATEFARATQTIVEDRCGALTIPLFVNGHRVNRSAALPTPYSLGFSSEFGGGVLGIASQPTRVLMGGGIVLEAGAPILGPDVAYILDSPRLSPTLSRNAVRRDNSFEALLREARSHLPSFTAHVADALKARVLRLKQEGHAVERELDMNDRAAMEWLRSKLLEPEDTPHPFIRSTPVLETADGGLVSADDLIDVIRREGRIPSSRVPRTRDEISGYVDRGVPVLLLYRDLEDFLERQGIQTIEVDGRDDGAEVHASAWSRGESALAARPQRRAPKRSRRNQALLALVAVVLASIAATWMFASEKPAPVTNTISYIAPSDPVEANLAYAEVDSTSGWRPIVMLLAIVVAGFSLALAFAAFVVGTIRKSHSPASWLREEAGAPLTTDEGEKRRRDVLRRALFHPIDFLVARGWSLRASGHRSLTTATAITGYRELVPEHEIRSGVRLDLDRVEIGYVDLVSSVGEPHDGRILLVRGARVLLNRNHPTIRDLTQIAGQDPARARILLDILLATDPELARGTDPRQAEWDLLGRAEHGLTEARS